MIQYDSLAPGTVTVSKVVRTSPERAFLLWTNPDQIKKWWGPVGVECEDVSVDLRVGGSYRIANRLSTGEILWIHGNYEEIEPPHRLVYTWAVGLDSTPSERVIVSFRAVEGGTEVLVVHEDTPDAPTRDSHGRGWQGCLDGLAEFIVGPDQPAHP